jgi:hypothetical protein
MHTRSVRSLRHAGSGVAALVLALLWAGVLAAPAHAHGRGSDATNYSARILEAPDLPGVSWAIYGGDELLEVTNTTAAEVVVLGYPQTDPEPYLRVGPDGVFQNRNSEATYVNEDRMGLVEVPAHVDRSAPPDWEQLTDANSAAWHDHRIHYMGAGLHPSITDPSVETLVYEQWEVPFLYDGQEHVVIGELRWVPGPSPVPWLALGLVLALPALVGLRTRPTAAGGAAEDSAAEGSAAEGSAAEDSSIGDPQGSGEQGERWPGLARPAAVVLGLIVVLNVSHLIDDLFAVPLPTGVRAGAAAQTVLFLAIGLFGAVRGWQSGDGAFTALGVGAGAVFVGQGLLYWSVLGVSQIASLFPDWFARLTVAASVAQIIPLGIVAVIGTRRLLPPLPEDVGAADAHV